jgi:NADH dehydrogenase/NADH:ubiquinone oxidoreductase subunit G
MLIKRMKEKTEMVAILINGKNYQTQEGENVLKVAIREGIEIPYLCYQDALSPFGACRLCMVEVISGGKPGLTTSCTLPVAEGLEVGTETTEVVNIRNVLLELYLSEAPGSKKIQELAEKYGVNSSRFTHIDVSAKGDRCVLCGLCVRVCDEILRIGAINYADRGTNTSINTPWYDTSSACIGCGACEYVCPADAIDIFDQDGERIMETWNRTSLKLKQCEESMKHFATERVIELVRSKNINFLGELEGLSPDNFSTNQSVSR